MTDILHVWMGDRRHVGVFSRDDGGRVVFQYDSDTDAPISVSLPLDGGWSAGVPEAFLDNLLPDEETARYAMMHRLGAASTDVFDLLDGVDSTGGLVETQGFLSVLPASAGMIPVWSVRRPARSCAPRKRGDDPL